MSTSSIYLLDSNSIHRQMIRYHLLRSGFRETKVVPDLNELFYYLGKGQIPNFIILDFEIIEPEPLALLKKIRSAARQSGIIFFTEHEDEALAGLLMRNGADDYILKGGSNLNGLNELCKNLRYLAEVARIS